LNPDQDSAWGTETKTCRERGTGTETANGVPGPSREGDIMISGADPKNVMIYNDSTNYECIINVN